jgi:hypothetical protein
MHKFIIRAAAVILTAGLILAGCNNPTGGGTGLTGGGPDKTALIAAITAAEAAKAGVAVNTTAANVPLGTSWVEAGDMATFTGKITAAGVVRDSTSANQGVVDAAVEALNAAISTFNGAKKAGTGTPVDKDALIAKITEAKTARDSVIVAEDGDDVVIGKNWATQAQIDTLNEVITAAESAITQVQVNTALTNLTTALTAFNDVVSTQQGTKADGFMQDDLDALIEQAIAARAVTPVSTENGADIPPTGVWVNQTDRDTLNAAINAASGSPEDPNEAYLALSDALIAFNAARQPGVTPDKTGLHTAITDADAAKNGVVPATNSDGAPSGSYWVTQEQLDALVGVYTASVSTYNSADASQIDVDEAVEALDAAVSTFNDAKALGTATNRLTITGLQQIYGNGTGLGIALLEENFGVLEEGDENFDAVHFTKATVTDGSVVWDLSGLDDISGDSYYVGFTADEILFFISQEKITFTGFPASRSYGTHFQLMPWSFQLGDIIYIESEETLDSLFEADYGVDYADWVKYSTEDLKEKVTPQLSSLVDMHFFKDPGFTQPYNGTDVMNAETVVYLKLRLWSGGDDDRGEKIGEIRGTIALTDIPDFIGELEIRAFSSGAFDSRDEIELSGITEDSGTVNWTISLCENDGNWDLITGNTEVYFNLWVKINGINGGFEFNLGPKILNMDNKGEGISGVNFTNVSLAYVTLSGTINVTYQGGLVPKVRINASGTGGSGQCTLVSPGSDASWSMLMPEFTPPATVYFNVEGMTASYDHLFYSSDIPPKTVSNLADLIDLGTITGE